MNAVLIAAALATGQYACQQPTYYQPAYRQPAQHYVAPTYQQPAQHYGAPTYAYGGYTQATVYQPTTYGYAQNYYPPVVDRLLVTFTEPYAYGGLLAQQQRAAAAEKERADLSTTVASLDEKISRIGNLLTTQGANRSVSSPPTPSDKAPPNPEPNPAPPDKVGPGTGDAAPPPPPAPVKPADPSDKFGNPAKPPANPSGIQASAAVARVMGARCAKCHTSPAKGGGDFVLFDSPEQLATFHPLQVQAIWNKVLDKEMPPKPAPPLTADQVAAFKSWREDNRDAVNAALSEMLRSMTAR